MRIVAIAILTLVGTGLVDADSSWIPRREIPLKPTVKPGIIQVRREVMARMLLKLAQHQELRDKKASIKSYQRLLDDFGDTQEIKYIVPDIKRKIIKLKQ